MSVKIQEGRRERKEGEVWLGIYAKHSGLLIHTLSHRDHASQGGLYILALFFFRRWIILLAI